jgi:hypothetical protein
MTAKKKLHFFYNERHLEFGCHLKKPNINFNSEFITNLIINIPQSFSFLDSVLWSEIQYDRKKRFTAYCEAVADRRNLVFRQKPLFDR